MIDSETEFWSKFQRHKCKQRLTKLHQMIIRKRKLKLSDNNTQEVQVPINKKYEKRELNREAKALQAAQVERAIEKELLNRLKVGTFYKDIYNLDKKDFEEKLNENEMPDQTQYEVDEEFENEGLDAEEDENLLGGDLIDENDMDEDELRMLQQAQAEDSDDDIEDLGHKVKLGKRKKPVKISYEMEEELENGGGKKLLKKRVKG